MIGFIKVLRLTEQEKNQIIALGMQSRPILEKWASRIYGRVCIQDFRNDLMRGRFDNHAIPKSDLEVLKSMNQAGCRLLEHIVLTLANFARSFHRSNVNSLYEYDDYFQEGCMAALQAAFGYDGTSEPITCLITAAKNQMIDMKCKKKRVITFQDNSDQDFNLNSVVQTTSPISDTERFALWEAIDKANLTECEMIIITGFMNGEKCFKKRAKDFKNPKTGKALNGNKVLADALRKIRVQYDTTIRKAA
jgi:DNA-directed RNA polymerase specialized sigma24 family protein